MHQKITVSDTPVYPREGVKRVLELGASALIVVHNHRSGDPTLSRADIAMTREIQNAAKALRVELHDHFVIGQAQDLSFRAEGLSVGARGGKGPGISPCQYRAGKNNRLF